MSAVSQTLFPSPWQQAMATAYTRAEDLLRALNLDPAEHGFEDDRFPLRVPRAYAARMRRGDPLDPLLLQVLPRRQESLPVAGFVADPVGDLASARQPGLLQKYAGRALIITTGACAVHCRYCFRRSFPYPEHQSGRRRLTAITDALAGDASIREVILSGGDPLSLANGRLAELLDAIDSIPHVRRIRLHTRTPVVLPARVDAGLLQILEQLKTPVVTVLHCNHPAEMDDDLRTAARQLRAVSHSLLNQAVLLRQVNDQTQTQVALSETLFDAGILPYYLHQLDPVAGAAHFAVPDEQALQLHRDMAGQLPGYLLPRLVRELPGAESKTPL